MKLCDEMQVGAGQDAGREQKNEDKNRIDGWEFENYLCVCLVLSSSFFVRLCFPFFFLFLLFPRGCTQTPATKVSG